MGIFDFLKGNKEDKEINRIIGKVRDKGEIIKTVNRAISLRNLDRHSEAIALLKQVIAEYPPALSILGNTYLKIL
ncbi:MAG: tetratricopeptide repeat protein [Planctomycetota bacterium]